MEILLDVNKLGIVELEEKDVKKIDGGILVSIAAGVIGYVVYEIADECVERATGKTIGNHISDGIDAVGNLIFWIKGGFNYYE